MVPPVVPPVAPRSPVFLRRSLAAVVRPRCLDGPAVRHGHSSQRGCHANPLCLLSAVDDRMVEGERFTACGSDEEDRLIRDRLAQAVSVDPSCSELMD